MGVEAIWRRYAAKRRKALARAAPATPETQESLVSSGEATEAVGVAEYVSALLASQRLGRQVAHHREQPALDPVYGDALRPWPKAILDLMAAAGAPTLYEHQARATDLIRSGRHVVVATPTASGKTFIYNLPVIERFLQDPDSRALYLFPLKALAQDQLKTFQALTGAWPEAARPSAALYDGDTSPWFRKKIRDKPPTVLLTNPEMLHLSVLPHHERWTEFLAGLTHIVVDEVHTYRGVLGSHMAQVFRRLLRVCARYGARPTFIFCSATVANPAELAGQLTGLTVEAVTQSGAPQGKRHYVFVNPLEGAAQAAILLLQSALHRGLRTIVYTQSRKMTELISLWATERSRAFKDKISAYRAGFLPEERREIEDKMHRGELLAVISTSALELGIDIGALDLCILVGYPGTVMATMQRGGRVGRTRRDCAVILVAQEDALDQYYMRNPETLFTRGAERAVLNPDNPVILAKHLECAAADLPLRPEEPWLGEPGPKAEIARLERLGTLLRSKDGSELYAARKAPQRDVDLRGPGGTYNIEMAEGGASIGQADEHRAFRETHKGAIYLHKGRTYVVEDLDLAARVVRVKPAKVDYYTRARGAKVTEILETREQKIVWGTRMSLGALKVTETITGYEKRRARGGVLLGITPLDLPPIIFDTEGLWFEIPLPVQRRCEAAMLHFMGGIHALEHAAIGILPLLVLTDRNDLGGISTPMHAQVGGPAIFIYDGAPGGVGLSRQAFAQAQELFERTMDVVAACACEYGCPSCVHSPKCGSGNRPIDKAAALFIVREMAKETPEPPTLSATPVKPTQVKETTMPEITLVHEAAVKKVETAKAPIRYGVLDVETRRSAEEVGGWHMAWKMGVSVAVLYDSGIDEFLDYEEKAIPELANRLAELDLVIGFNILRFDYKVLGPHCASDLPALPTLDLLEDIRTRLGYRLSLDNLAKATLGVEKSADGLQALAWWKEGLVDRIAVYCRKDVALTRDIFLHGRDKGYVLFSNKAKRIARMLVAWP